MSLYTIFLYTNPTGYSTKVSKSKKGSLLPYKIDLLLVYVSLFRNESHFLVNHVHLSFDWFLSGLICQKLWFFDDFRLFSEKKLIKNSYIHILFNCVVIATPQSIFRWSCKWRSMTVGAKRSISWAYYFFILLEDWT